MDCIFSILASQASTKFIYILINSTSTNLLPYPSWVSSTVLPTVLLNENYSGAIHVRSDAVLILPGCDSLTDTLIAASKRYHLITTYGYVAVLLDSQCFDDKNITAEDIILDIRDIVNPSATFIFLQDTNSSEIHWTSSVDVDISINNCSYVSWTRVNSVPKHNTLRVAIATQPPYVMGGKTWIGVELRLVAIVAETFNVNLRFLEPPNGESPRIVIDSSGKTIGLFGILDRLEADLAIGGLASVPDRVKVSEILAPHTIDKLTWVIPTPHQTENWTSIYIALSPGTWILVLVTILLSSFVPTLFFRGDNTFTTNLSEGFLNSVSALLDQGYRRLPHCWMFRIFLIFFLMYNLIITNTYRSILATLLTAAPKVPWYETLIELVDDGHIMYLIPSSKALYEQSGRADITWAKIMSPGHHAYSDDVPGTLAQIAKHGRGAMLSIGHPTTLAIHSGLTRSDNTPLLMFLKDGQFDCQISMYAAPGFPQYDFVNSLVLHLVAGGFLDLWRRQIFLVAETTASKLPRQAVRIGHPPLSIKHLITAFAVLFVFLSISFCVFLVEVVVSRYNCKGAIMNCSQVKKSDGQVY